MLSVSNISKPVSYLTHVKPYDHTCIFRFHCVDHCLPASKSLQACFRSLVLTNPVRGKLKHLSFRFYSGPAFDARCSKWLQAWQEHSQNKSNTTRSPAKPTIHLLSCPHIRKQRKIRWPPYSCKASTMQSPAMDKSHRAHPLQYTALCLL
jgi:hypothetical protein